MNPISHIIPMHPYFHIIHLDKTTIKTQLHIHPDLRANPKAFVRKYYPEIRNMKPTRGMSANGPTWNLALDVLTFKGIKVKLRQVADDPLTVATIHFNPGVCLHGDNGSILSLTVFLHALSLLVKHLKPLLSNPDDWIDLIPGLRSGGVAYWDYLEIFHQYADPDGKLLAGFRNAQWGNGNTSIRHWPESMVIGGKRSKLQFGFYRKAVEMVAHDKMLPEQLSDYRHILRLEVRLKDDKLVHFLGNERNVEKIDGVMRLVRFYPQDTVFGHRTSCSVLHGVFCSGESLEEPKSGDQLSPLGRQLARVALDPRTSHTFQELLAHIRFYTKASSDTMGNIRKAGIAELSRLSTISKDELFSDAAYETRHSVWSEKQEKKVRHEIEDVLVHRLITDAYRPPDQPFQPITRWPEYLRV